MKVFCQGFDMVGCGNIVMSQVVFEDICNSKEVEKYQNNILWVVWQFKYCLIWEWVIDLGLFINGLLVVMVELKIDFMQVIDDVILQYKYDCLLVDLKIN